MRTSNKNWVAHEQMMAESDKDTARHELEAIYEIDMSCREPRTRCSIICASKEQRKRMGSAMHVCTTVAMMELVSSGKRCENLPLTLTLDSELAPGFMYLI